MTNPDAGRDLTLDALETLARARGYDFPRDRLLAVLPEVRRLHELIRRLQALPLDEEPPAQGFEAE